MSPDSRIRGNSAGAAMIAPCYSLLAIGCSWRPLTEKVTQSPLARYREHLEKGELAYQFDRDDRGGHSSARDRSEIGIARLERRVSAGLGTVHATTVNHPR